MIKVAIIGAGAISSAHVEAYKEFSDRCEIVAVVDTQIKKAESLIKKYQLNAVALSDYRELLGNTDITLISVCTPPSLHAEIAISCLSARKHTIVEKPMAASLEECDKMISASEANNMILSIVAQNRFKTSMMKLKSMLDKGVAGNILHTQVDSFWWRGHSYYDLWWRGKWESEGGGCTLNHAVHHLDLLQWMQGMPTEVCAVMSNLAHDNAEVEDISIALLRYSNGSLAQVTSSVVHHGEEQQIIFQGEDARISFPWKISASISKPNGFPERDKIKEEELNRLYSELPDIPYEGHFGQIDNVLSAIENKTSLIVDGNAGRRTLELIVAIYKSASLKSSVSLPISRDDKFYTGQGLLHEVPRFFNKTSHISDFIENENTITL